MLWMIFALGLHLLLLRTNSLIGFPLSPFSPPHWPACFARIIHTRYLRRKTADFVSLVGRSNHSLPCSSCWRSLCCNFGLLPDHRHRLRWCSRARMTVGTLCCWILSINRLLHTKHMYSLPSMEASLFAVAVASPLTFCSRYYSINQIRLYDWFWAFFYSDPNVSDEILHKTCISSCCGRYVRVFQREISARKKVPNKLCVHCLVCCLLCSWLSHGFWEIGKSKYTWQNIICNKTTLHRGADSTP